MDIETINSLEVNLLTRRQENIERNQQFLKEIGISSDNQTIVVNNKQSTKRKKLKSEIEVLPKRRSTRVANFEAVR